MEKKRNIVKNTIISIFFCFALIPSFAYADAGIPIVLLNTPLLMFQALAFIMCLEALIYKWTLNVRFKEAFFPAIIANLVSTLFYIPLFLIKALIFGLGIELKRIIGPKAIFSEWAIYIIELILAYCISVIAEFVIVEKFFKSIDDVKILRAVCIANTVTYIILTYMLIYNTMG